MALTFTLTQVRRMADVLYELGENQEDVEDAARAVLAEALEIVQERAKFTVVGQIKPTDDKFVLGYYPTEKQAIDAALQAAYSTQTHEEARVWVIPVHHGSPHSYYQKRKKQRDWDELADRSYREKELARRVQWFEDHPDEPIPDGWTVFISSDSETLECAVCDGTGRIPDADQETHGDRRKEVA